MVFLLFGKQMDRPVLTRQYRGPKRPHAADVMADGPQMSICQGIINFDPAMKSKPDNLSDRREVRTVPA